jgi:hypothetical protein
MLEAVNHPAHYQGKIECIEAIALALQDDPLYPPIAAAIFFNVVKYRWREHLKNGQEDLAKANWYRNWLFEHLSARCPDYEVQALLSDFDDLVAKALLMK